MKKIYNLFLCLFAAVMAIIMVLCAERVVSRGILSVIYFCAVAAVIGGMVYALRRFRELFTDRRCLALASALLLVLLTIQIVHCCRYQFLPTVGDYESIISGIREVIGFGELRECQLYFLRYEHLRCTLAFYSVFNWVLNRIVAPQPIHIIATTILNSVLCCAGGLLLYFSAKRIISARAGLLAVVIFCLHNSYTASTAYIYSHSLSVFFVCLVVFVYSFCVTAGSKPAAVISYFALGVSLAMARSIEGIIAIGIVAALIACFIKAKKPLEFIKTAAALILGVVVTVYAAGVGLRFLDIMHFENEENELIPLTHWIMMGLGDEGLFSEEDYNATINLPTAEAKRAYAAEQIRLRIEEKGFGGLLRLAKVKLSRMWAGSAYGYKLKAGGTDYYVGYMLALYAAIAFGLAARVRTWKRRTLAEIDSGAVFRIWMVGIFFFAMIWESAYVYLFSSMPVIIFLAAYEMGNLFLRDKA